MSTPAEPALAPSRTENMLGCLLFCGALLLHAWGMTVGWESKNLPGVEYRQAQTALSAYWIKQQDEFSLAYPTPVLGKPWSAPMEFPLYQWAVVLTGKATGWGLTKAGRAVSMACFYLTLPALWLLLARWQIAPGRRWLVLALVASCPFYIFYGRAFLIETMALCCSVWFWVCFERAIMTRRLYWLVIASIGGAGAGLVKVTTFMLFLLPVAVWGLERLWSGRGTTRWRTDLAWMSAVLAPALAVTWWWIWKADSIKAANPMADFLGSKHMTTFNLGSGELRLSPELWNMKWRIVRDELTWLPLLGLTFAWLLLGGRHRLAGIIFCLMLFGAALWIFPVLYAYHDYYYVANAVYLLLAAGLVLVGVSEHPRWRWAALGWATLLVAGQAFWYAQHYYPVQRGVSEGGDALTAALRQLMGPEEVLVVTGQDWNAMTPYYARRRALMLRLDVEDDVGRIDAALSNLTGERIGALLVTGRPWQQAGLLVERLATRGISPRPLLRWRETWVFLPEARRPQVQQFVRDGKLPEATLVFDEADSPQPLAGPWHRLADLPLQQQLMFDAMQPRPERFYARFEPSSQAVFKEIAFNAHPLTKLVFQLPPGDRTLRLQAWFNPDAYTCPPGERTDGVEIILSALVPGSPPRELARRPIDPSRNLSDRGPVDIRMDFHLTQDCEVELTVGPGPDNRDTRDWVWLRGPVEFR